VTGELSRELWAARAALDAAKTKSDRDAAVERVREVSERIRKLEVPQKTQGSASKKKATRRKS
jgi:hypothetical protein